MYILFGVFHALPFYSLPKFHIYLVYRVHENNATTFIVFFLPLVFFNSIASSFYGYKRQSGSRIRSFILPNDRNSFLQPFSLEAINRSCILSLSPMPLSICHFQPNSERPAANSHGRSFSW